jgi:hypothetical protein
MSLITLAAAMNNTTFLANPLQGFFGEHSKAPILTTNVADVVGESKKNTAPLLHSLRTRRRAHGRHCVAHYYMYNIQPMYNNPCHSWSLQETTIIRQTTILATSVAYISAQISTNQHICVKYRNKFNTYWHHHSHEATQLYTQQNTHTASSK